MNLNSNIYVWFDKSLPFTPEHGEYIYVEKEYNPYLNDFFNRLHLPYCHGWDSCYLPKVVKSITAERLKYMFPYLYRDNLEGKVDSLTSETLLSYVLPKSQNIIRHGLIKYNDADNDGYRFEYYEIVPSDYKKLSKDLFNATTEYYDSYSQVRGIEDYLLSDVDHIFLDTYNYMLSTEILSRIHRLKIRGVSEAAIRSLLDIPVVVSRMVITEDFRIMLPDYDVEIVMTPLVKAVYILFLLHPEGILLRQLPNYQDELLEIYKFLVHRSDYNSILQSIADVTNPNKNSINEKCARIREAFYKEFRNDLAEFYCVNGNLYEPKKIELDRSKLEFENKEFLQVLQKYRLR